KLRLGQDDECERDEVHVLHVGSSPASADPPGGGGEAQRSDCTGARRSMRSGARPPLSPAARMALQSGTRIASGRDEPMAFFGFLLAFFLFCRLGRELRRHRAAVGEDGATYMTWHHGWNPGCGAKW